MRVVAVTIPLVSNPYDNLWGNEGLPPLPVCCRVSPATRLRPLLHSTPKVLITRSSCLSPWVLNSHFDAYRFALVLLSLVPLLRQELSWTSSASSFRLLGRPLPPSIHASWLRALKSLSGCRIRRRSMTRAAFGPQCSPDRALSTADVARD